MFSNILWYHIICKNIADNSIWDFMGRKWFRLSFNMRCLIFDWSLTPEFIFISYRFYLTSLVSNNSCISVSIAAFPMHDWLTVCSNDVLGPANLKKISPTTDDVFLFITGRGSRSENDNHNSTLSRVTHI